MARMFTGARISLAAATLAAASVSPAMAERAPASLAFRVQATGYALAPFAHARFCIEYPDQCKRRRVSIRRPIPALKEFRLQQLAAVQTAVNRAIRPQHDKPGILNDKWSLSPAKGDCDDYAVTKRAALLKAGWPSRSLLLASVRLADGQAHLVLVARMSGGDYVLDNLQAEPQPVARMRYRWTMMQDESNPTFWRHISTAKAVLAFTPPAPVATESTKPIAPAALTAADAAQMLRLRKAS